MTTPYRGYTEIPGAATPDVPYRVNLALREVDADVQGVAASVDTVAGVATGASNTAMDALGKVQAQDLSISNYTTRVEALEVLGSLTPGSVTDATMTDIAANPTTLFSTWLEDSAVGRDVDGSPRYHPERWYFGPKGPGYEKGLLYIEYHGHFLAQRFAFGGVWDPAIRTAPTIEVIPAAPFARPDLDGYAEKTGANAINPVSCIQAYAFGHGDTDSRSYFCIEPHLTYDKVADTYGGEFVFAAWSSGPDGPGVLPVQWRAGDVDAFNVSVGGVTEIQRQLIVGTQAVSNSPFQVHRENVNDQPISAFKQFSSNSIGPHLALQKYRGTKDAPAAIALNDLLGRISGGTSDALGNHTGAEIRFIAQENWVNGSAQGARAAIQATKAGTVTKETVAQFDVPTISLDTSARLLVNIGGVTTEKRVIVGAADSGGAGFRSLRIAN